MEDKWSECLDSNRITQNKTLNTIQLRMIGNRSSSLTCFDPLCHHTMRALIDMHSHVFNTTMSTLGYTLPHPMVGFCKMFCRTVLRYIPMQIVE